MELTLPGAKVYPCTTTPKDMSRITRCTTNNMVDPGLLALVAIL